MSIIIANAGHKVVATIAERDGLVKRFDGMRAYVKDATADVVLGGGAAEYIWDGAAERWTITWAERKADLKFVTETKTIVGTAVTADYPINDNAVWGAYVMNNQDIILGDVFPSVSGSTIDLGTNEFEGETLIFTYAHGSMSTEMQDIWESKASKDYVDARFEELGLKEDETGKIHKNIEVDTTSFSVKETEDEEDLNLQTQQVFVLDGIKNRVMAFDNQPGEGKAMTIVIKFKGKGGTITWPAGVLWHNDEEPELADTYTLVVLMWDGEEWIGNVGMKR